MKAIPAKATFIDLFAGCGGLSLGLNLAGWHGLFAVEKNPMAFESLKANFFGQDAKSRGIQFNWPAYLPIRPMDVIELIEGPIADANLALRGKIDLISGGPPCQGFSFSGTRRQADPRNKLIVAYAKAVLQLRPKLLFVENVPGILTPHRAKERRQRNPNKVGRPPVSYAERLSGLLKDAYHFVWKTVDAVDFGVPQHRRRFFGVGILREAVEDGVFVSGNQICEFDIDGKEFVSNLDPFKKIDEIRMAFLNSNGLCVDKPTETVADAISDFLEYRDVCPRPCEDPESPIGFNEIPYRVPLVKQQSPYVRLMRKGMNGQLPDSLRLARHSDEISSRFSKILCSCPKGVRLNEGNRIKFSTLKNRVVPLHPNKAGHTITTLPDDILHYSEPRILTVRECARLQSFPDWFKIRGKFTTGGHRRKIECPRYTQIGNAVPPLLAEAWGYALGYILERINSRPH